MREQTFANTWASARLQRLAPKEVHPASVWHLIKLLIELIGVTLAASVITILSIWQPVVIIVIFAVIGAVWVAVNVAFTSCVVVLKNLLWCAAPLANLIRSVEIIVRNFVNGIISFINQMIDAVSWIDPKLHPLQLLVFDIWPIWGEYPNPPFENYPANSPGATLDYILMTDCADYNTPLKVLTFFFQYITGNGVCRVATFLSGSATLAPYTNAALSWVAPNYLPGPNACSFGEGNVVCGWFAGGILLVAMLQFVFYAWLVVSLRSVIKHALLFVEAVLDTMVHLIASTMRLMLHPDLITAYAELHNTARGLGLPIEHLSMNREHHDATYAAQIAYEKEKATRAERIDAIASSLKKLSSPPSAPAVRRDTPSRPRAQQSLVSPDSSRPSQAVPLLPIARPQGQSTSTSLARVDRSEMT